MNVSVILVAFKLILAAVLLLPVAPSQLVILVTSQRTSVHRYSAEDLRQNLRMQANTLSSSIRSFVKVRLVVDEMFKHTGYWTLLPILPQLFKKPKLITEKTKWIIVCTESTYINLELLVQKLNAENSTESLYLGHALRDREATIIHHFAFYENPRWFPYPMLQSGVVFSYPMLSRLAAMVNDKLGGSTARTEFAIDPAHELARFIYSNVRLRNEVVSSTVKGQKHKLSMHKEERPANKAMKKIILRKAAYICGGTPALTPGSCAMYARPTNTSKCLAIKRSEIYFAIKTCSKYHKERVPIIESTWAPFTVHRKYFSDATDASSDVPIIATDVPNAETGHCAKTMAILGMALKDITRTNRRGNARERIRWLLLADDDTLLSVSGVCQILGCFDAAHEIYLGERYGYRVHADDGFNYVTGGGGIALSLSTVRLIIQKCSCPSPAAPDDMILGACLHSLQVQAIHSARFHQARPNDYAAELLQLEPPISFHKYWQLDPMEVYETWFATADRQMLHLEAIRLQQQRQQQLQQHSWRNISKITLNQCSRSSWQAQLTPEIALPTQLQRLKDKHIEL